LIVPRYFFVTDLIEKRPPLSANARRAGWVGCNILISKVPEIGKIFYIKDRKIIKPENILQEWKKTSFLQEAKNLESRGWLLDTLNCVERIGQNEFNLDQIYAFEAELKQKHPENNHIKDKLRQQLQFLRDKGLIEFLGRGQYRKIANG
jgi:type II restriction enzyme